MTTPDVLLVDTEGCFEGAATTNNAQRSTFLDLARQDRLKVTRRTRTEIRELDGALWADLESAGVTVVEGSDEANQMAAALQLNLQSKGLAGHPDELTAQKIQIIAIALVLQNDSVTSGILTGDSATGELNIKHFASHLGCTTISCADLT